MNGRSLDVKVSAFRIWPDQAIGITRFEFMSVQFERFEIADAIITGAGFEVIPEGERAECGVAAGAAAVDHRSIGIDISARGQKFGAVHTVVNIDNSPSAAQTLAISPAIAAAATIVDVEYGDTAAGPILNREHQHGDRCGCRPAVTLYQQERFFIRRTVVISVSGGVIKSVSS